MSTLINTKCGPVWLEPGGTEPTAYIDIVRQYAYEFIQANMFSAMWVAIPYGAFKSAGLGCYKGSICTRKGADSGDAWARHVNAHTVSVAKDMGL